MSCDVIWCLRIKIVWSHARKDDQSKQHQPSLPFTHALLNLGTHTHVWIQQLRPSMAPVAPLWWTIHRQEHNEEEKHRPAPNNIEAKIEFGFTSHPVLTCDNLACGFYMRHFLHVKLLLASQSHISKFLSIRILTDLWVQHAFTGHHYRPSRPKRIGHVTCTLNLQSGLRLSMTLWDSSADMVANTEFNDVKLVHNRFEHINLKHISNSFIYHTKKRKITISEPKSFFQVRW